MNSTIAALIAPSSGVAQSVSGYLVGMGDGVTNVFTAPPEITAISTLYRRDWQGNMALSASARTNICLQSETLNSWSKLGGGTGTAPVVTNAYAIGPDGTKTNACRVQCNRGAGVTGSDYSVVDISITHTSGANYSEGIWLKSNTGINQRVMLYWSMLSEGSITNVVTVAPEWQKFFKSGTGTSSSGGIQMGARVSYGDASIDILATCAQVETGSAPTSYIGPTTTAPVALTDYSLTGNTITLAETPVRAAEISLDGTGAGLPLVPIR